MIRLAKISFISFTKFAYSGRYLLDHSESLRYFSTKPGQKEYVKIEIKNEDLEYQQIKGSGPGGQAVNKTNNCIILKNKPTGITVRSHASRDTETNKHYAIKMLKEKLDDHINGELSKKNQEIAKKRKQEAIRRKRSREKYQQKEGAANQDSKESK